MFAKVMKAKPTNAHVFFSPFMPGQQRQVDSQELRQRQPHHQEPGKQSHLKMLQKRLQLYLRNLLLLPF